MADKEKDDAYCFDLLKESLSPNSDLSVGARVGCGILGLFGTIIVDPVKLGMKALGICNSNDLPGSLDFIHCISGKNTMIQD